MQGQTVRKVSWSRTGDAPGYKGGTVKQEVADAAKKVAPVTDVKEAEEATASCPGSNHAENPKDGRV